MVSYFYRCRFIYTIIKQPSADINPANQQGSIIKSGAFARDKVKSDIPSSFAGRISGKAAFNSLVRPLPIKAFRDTNFSKPCFVKCSLFFTKKIACLKHTKSLDFLVINGYFLIYPRLSHVILLKIHRVLFLF